MPDMNVLIKPASGLCNLECSYCFYHDETRNREVESYGRMSEETLEQIIQKTIEASERSCTLTYQGGEPTLRGLDFFKKSIELQEKYNHRGIAIHNAIQTNGMLVDEKWAAFFAKNNFLVGISLDGTEFTHNRFRIDSREEGTFWQVIEAIEKLKKHGVSFNILTVVNSLTARKIPQIYRFFSEQGYEYLQFIPCLNPIGEEDKKYDFTLTPQGYGRFLNTLFDLWYEDLLRGKTVHVQLFEEYIRMLYRQVPGVCGMLGVCTRQHVIEADGAVYPCDFYVLDQYRLGNLKLHSYKEIEKKREALGFIEESYALEAECRECRYYPLCRGGCKRYRKPLHCLCESYKMFFDYCLERLEKAALLYGKQY